MNSIRKLAVGLLGAASLFAAPLEGGKIIGAIGCSGGTGAQDEVACKAGAALFK